MQHGTINAYTNGKCRCPECRAANAEQSRLRRERIDAVDEARLADLLHELAPFGLTDDCPARRKLAA